MAERETAPIERELPHNIDAEQAVLGSLVLDPYAVSRVVERLRPQDFYRTGHSIIYSIILDLYHGQGPADFVTLSDAVIHRWLLEAIGGPSVLTSLLNRVPTTANLEHYTSIVVRLSIMRRLIRAASEITTLAYSADDEVTALAQAEELLHRVGQDHTRSEFSPIEQILNAYYKELDKVHAKRGSLGLKTGFTELDQLTGGLQKSDLIVLAARPGVGKCLVASTLIDDPETGERLSIETCVQRRLARVYGLSGEGTLRPTAVTHWLDNGVQPCYRVQTTTGRSVEVTGTHPFLTGQGWKPLNELTVGSAIAIPRAVPVFGHDESWPLDLVRLLAYYIAEGRLTDTCPEFTNTDPVLVEDFRSIIARQFPDCAIRYHHLTYAVSRPRHPQPGRGAIMTPNLVAVWLKGLGLWSKLSKEKQFPACVWTWSKRYLAEFLRVLMSCDGSIYALTAQPHLPRIEFTVASPQLARDVHHALTRFGILAKYSITSHGAYRVHVTLPDAVRRYQEQIGWIGEKTQRFAGFTSLITARMSNCGHPPKETWALVRQAALQHGLSLIEIARRSGETTLTGHLSGYNSHTRRTLPAYRLAGYAAVLADPQLQMIASPDLYWDTIASIEAIGEQRVYDLTVPDGANFVAQDILVHNSALALSIAYNVAHGPDDPAFLDRSAPPEPDAKPKRVAFFALEMSKEQLLQRLISMQSGIDQHRLRMGTFTDEEWDFKIGPSMGILAGCGIFIDDTPSLSTTEMRNKARLLANEADGLDLIIVDYLQLMQGRAGGHSDNRVQEVSEISRSLKALARELNVPVLALSQLSRSVESRQSRVPQLSDLRESGSIEQDSDIVLFIYRDELYNPETDKKHIADIIVAKHRNGPTGQFSLIFEANKTIFRTLPLHPRP
jgi:replicative DNA helicase